MFLSMAVSLYSSRVVLQTLGVDDFGIYNVVGGVVAMFSFINSTMSSATSRFLTFALGKDNFQELKDTFSSAFWVHAIIVVIVVLLSETIGLWFLNYKMVIPEERIFSAHVVFQLSILSTVISITQVPYNASIIAHENMGIYAYVEMANVFFKLFILYLLVFLPFDKLIVYGVLVLLVNTGIAMYYRYYCRIHFKECRISRKWSPEIVKPMLSFSGWDLYGNLSVTARTEGVAMLLNVFFGPVMNASAGIATSVQNAVSAFANNINTAVRPQIIKYYAQGKYAEMSDLINNASKLNFLVLAIIMIPLIGEIEFVLSLWLGSFPDYADVFSTYTLLFCLIANMSFVVNTGNHAAGKIIRPSLINGTLYLMVIPFSYLSFKFGGYAWTSFLFNVCAVFLGLLSNVYTLHLNCSDYRISTFIKDVLFRCLLIVIMPIVIVYIIRLYLDVSFGRLVLTTVSTTLVIMISGWYILLSKSIRKKVITLIKIRICKNN